MKEILVRQGEIHLKKDGQEITVHLKDPYKNRQEAALRQSVEFVVNHSDQVRNLMGGDIFGDVDVFQDPDFLPMVNALDQARVSRRIFSRRVRDIILASPQAPQEALARPLVQTFTSYVYSEVQRLRLERRARA